MTWRWKRYASTPTTGRTRSEHAGAVLSVLGATAAVLVVRTVSPPFGALAGGLRMASLCGWRPVADG